MKTEPALRNFMAQEKIGSYEEFHAWLAEEKEYLLTLKTAAKTNVETLEMEYVQNFVNLSASESVLSVIHPGFT